MKNVSEKELVFEMVKEIIDNEFPSEFDSHEFIKKFIWNYPVPYGRLLIKHENVATAHAEISNYLRNYADRLGIEQITPKKESEDIFGNENENAKWKKK